MTHLRNARKAIPWLLAAAAGAGLLVTVEAVSAPPDGRATMDKVALTRKLEGSEAKVTMKTLDASGKVLSSRTLTMATKLYEGGAIEKRIYRFVDPPDVKGTGILVFDYAAKPDDIWIFLPALRTSRRVLGGDRAKSFMGSEFSYGDLNIPPLDDYTYRSDREEQAGGEACYVVEVTPKSPQVAKDEGYQRKVYWVSKTTSAVRKGQFFGLDGKLLKELSTSNVKELATVNGTKRFRAMKMEMKNVQTGRLSVFETVSVSTNTPPDDFFTEAYLQRI